jgi:methyl-accepting chemotaxis protein
MRNWTIGRRIIVGFSVVIGIAVLLGAFAYACLITIGTQITRIAQDSLPGVTVSAAIEIEAQRRYTLVLRHVLATNAAAMAEVETLLKESDSKMDALLAHYEQTIFTTQDRENFERVKPAGARIRQIRADVILPLDHAGKQVEAAVAVKTQLLPAVEAYMSAVHAVFEFNKNGGDDASAAIMRQVTTAKTGVVIALLLALFVSAGIAFIIVRGTSRMLTTSVDELTGGAAQVASAAEQLSSASQSMSQGASEQAAALEETSASMEEMASMTRQNADHSQKGAQLMSDVERRVVESQQALTAMIASMQSIQESSAKVSRIIKTVDEIAFQTNILALNAAVEAARAGDAGMGFAVVADEVRNLAQRSLTAAKDTSMLIEEAIANAQQGDQRVREVTSSITAITSSVGEAKRLVDEVSAASKQQTQGIDQVSKAIAELEQLTQRTAANAEESAAASEELNSQAEMTMGVVTRLNALVGSYASNGAASQMNMDMPMPPPAQRGVRVVQMNRSHAA